MSKATKKSKQIESNENPTKKRNINSKITDNTNTNSECFRHSV